MLGPLVMGYLISLGNWWRQGFWGQALFLLLLGSYFFCSDTQKPVREIGSGFFGQVQKLIGDNHFRAILLVNGLAMGTQVTILLLGVTFLMEAKLCTLPVAGAILSAFSLFIMLGRLICSHLILRIPHSSIVLTLLWFQVVTLIIAWNFQGRISLIALAVSGLSFSGVYPTSMALAGVLFPRIAGSALGILTTIGGIGSMVLCWLTGFAASLTSMRNGFIILILACFIALVIFQLYHSAIRQRELSLTIEENNTT